eukprot:2574097-Rhodomonas_salina.1
MLDMGEEFATINGNRYAPVFLINSTQFCMTFLHATKTGAEIANIHCKAFAKAGYTPPIMMSDTVKEYGSVEVDALFTKYNIEHRYSNVEQQFQNTAAETIVNMI